MIIPYVNFKMTRKGVSPEQKKRLIKAQQTCSSKPLPAHRP